MTTPSVPRCGRLDAHDHHVWTLPSLPYGWGVLGYMAPERDYRCPGAPVIEGGARCADCGSVVCRCDEDLSDARRDEWWIPE